MSFTTLAFLAFFAAVFAVYWLLPQRWRWCALLAANGVFYAAGGQPHLAWALAVSALASYGAARALGRARRTGVRRALLWGGVGIPAALLVCFKYGGVLAQAAGAHWAFSAAVPLGISYYTLQTVSYVADVYRGKIQAEKHFGYYLAYLTFFPCFLSGPIERAGSLLPQLRGEGKFCADEAVSGGVYIILGMFQKLAVANNLANFADVAFQNPQSVTGMSLLFALILYSVQIYADFAGYSNMALGLAKMLGLRVTQNFTQPYFACSVKDFWRRWHISLSAWLRDYIYIPLGGSRCGKARRYFNVLFTFAVSGLWHGTGLCFLVWGALHGAYQAASAATQGLRQRAYRALRCNPQKLPARLWQMLCVWAAVTFAWLFFRVGCLTADAQMPASLGTVWYILQKIAADFSLTYSAAAGGLAMLHLTPVLLARLGLLVCVFFAAEVWGRGQGLPARLMKSRAPLRVAVCYVLLFLAVFFSGSGGSFLYFAF